MQKAQQTLPLLYSDLLLIPSLSTWPVAYGQPEVSRLERAVLFSCHKQEVVRLQGRAGKGRGNCDCASVFV